LAFESHSLLEVEPPVHTRLRRLVNRAFVSRQIAHLRPRIEERAHALVDALEAAGEAEGGVIDLIEGYATPIPVAVICWLLGVPEDRAPDLLRWSHAMVAMYQANRSRAVEDAAVQATLAFTAFMRDLLEVRREDLRREDPGPDLLSELIRAHDEAGNLSEEELITTAILLLNAGHEATVHTLGNGIRALLTHRGAGAVSASERIGPEVVEEILRYDPPLHLFTRYALEPVDLTAAEGDVPIRLEAGDRVGLLLGAANRDPALCADPHRFDPGRLAPDRTHAEGSDAGARHVSFGGGIHFCLGAPLARLELEVGLTVLFARAPEMVLAEAPRVADRYHFRGVEALRVRLRPNHLDESRSRES
jgi:cytochrome P450